jgi:hypothetical protein
MQKKCTAQDNRDSLLIEITETASFGIYINNNNRCLTLNNVNIVYFDQQIENKEFSMSLSNY